VMLVTIFVSWGLWFYKHCMKQVLAVVTDESIKIDHCRPLLWSDVTSAEERLVPCGLRELKVIILNTREDMNYHYNFLQKHNGGFTPFSIPLYNVILKTDADAISQEIARRVPLTKLTDVVNSDETNQVRE